jgi:hypothetical protein
MLHRVAPWTCLAALAAAAASGCSLLFDPDKIPLHADGPVPDAMPPPPDFRDDADPGLLTITGIEGPADGLYEGMGSGGGFPVVLVVSATSLVGDATIDAVWDVPGPEEPMVVSSELSHDDGLIAIALRLPVLRDPAQDSGTLDLRVTVSQNGGSASQSTTIAVTLLPQLALDGTTVTSFEARYSEIAITAATRIAGEFTAAPPRLVSMGAITMDGGILVNAQGQTAGPHSCDGGGQAGTSQCGGAGGGSNAAVVGHGGGGGGGGCAAAGDPGNSAAGPGGGGGTATCTAMVVPLGFDGTVENRGHGGGGGGDGTLGLGMGGTGGGGGGVVELRAGGALTITSGVIDANGAPGTTGSGAGGGGSGGLVLVRATGGVQMAASGWITALGRPGGATNTPGGAGKDGRIRVDSPTEFGATTPAAVSAPMLVDPPALSRAQSIDVMVRGTPGVYTLRNGGIDSGDVTIPSAGETTITGVTLGLGRNVMCMMYAQSAAVGATGGLPEAKNCVEIVYVP